MPSPPAQRLVAADTHRVPRPFSSFAVRSDESRHAFDARAPYGRVHVVNAALLEADSMARLAAEGRSRVASPEFPDVFHARTTLEELAAAAPGIADLAPALQVTGVLGPDPVAYQQSLAARIDYLVANGAGFHNDVNRHWSACLFWVLALDSADVEFVMPHARVRQPLTPGDLLVFDPTMAHGLCRPADHGQAVAASFEAGGHRTQVFLTGELLLSDASWAALGSPWLAVEEHERLGALDLRVAEFDDQTGAIKLPRTLLQSMKRFSAEVDDFGR